MKLTYAELPELYRLYLQHPQVSIDSRRVPDGGLFIALRGRTDGNQYAAAALAAGAAYAIVDDPEVAAAGDDRYLLVEDGLKALQQLAGRHRAAFRMPVFAITGSNGKTTTKELIAAVMSQQYRVHATPGNYNNHIGLPLTILSMPPGTEFLILEMGANHRGEIAELCAIGRPTHGLITNIGTAHLEGFGGQEGIRLGKGELYDFLRTNGGVVFVNNDEPQLADMAQGMSRIIPYFSSEEPSLSVAGLEIKTLATHPNLRVAFFSEARELVETDTQLAGKHNLQNVKSAIAVGRYFKVPGAGICAALSGYRPANHRSQWLTHRGVTFYWDAYNANPSSVGAALSSFSADSAPSDSVVVLGEMLELGEAAPAAHRQVALQAGQVARTVLLVGREMAEVAREFDRPHFADSGQLAEWFWQQEWAGKKVFVKGSRGNRLERLLD
ncbi:UDP-N-acetylmuramoyl-tripeptide--D-alanyl-D-alanine ligase [Lewinella marina]|uniref:UDP-N-acetylmuramoyl-tripeptide--D-alanyl-D-alanine ligase n=1 Tax=Neolewinella marina TaxID=438751 RepID=A0A2G0CCV4_9BACT|nr:UDP-N-acetylmuramoyl-tripeptide--D-alanyl-D-alanine ligase [Neolewinella marina]NJB86997.1 UDP-N-acetylmuramoyl-tripeptide--D-alanyl-D-alanine ligase [Neolewinella marina]PHK97809.1 UDP-N-acetylmuramoylalanyl-D-glutamyl-2, 6-diaminopimelate--D-alanyl-D-alanine ligase [Neolewinella marina]